MQRGALDRVRVAAEQRPHAIEHRGRDCAQDHCGDHVVVKLGVDLLEPDGDGHQVSGTLRIRNETLPVIAPAVNTTIGSEIRIESRSPVDHHAAGLGWAEPGMVRKVVDADLKLTLAREDFGR
jgi:hypothetical protein